jgi:hypothetical protein
VEGTGENRVAYFGGNVKVSLPDSMVWEGNRIMRNKNTVCFPAVWREDGGLIIYSTDKGGKNVFDIPYQWGSIKCVTLYRITTTGLRKIKKLKVNGHRIELEVTQGVPYYVIPDIPVGI